MVAWLTQQEAGQAYPGFAASHDWLECQSAKYILSLIPLGAVPLYVRRCALKT